jgi:hypothetical protein
MDVEDETANIIFQTEEYILEIHNELISLRTENDMLKRQIQVKDNMIKDFEKYLLSSNNERVEPEELQRVEPEELQLGEPEQTSEPENNVQNPSGVANYYNKNKDHIFRNLRNVMIKKGIYRNPRIPDNVLNTYTFHLYDSLPQEQKDVYQKKI